MRRWLLLAGTFGALALACSACDVAALPYAAKVGGHTVSVGQLNSVLDAFHDDATLGCLMSLEKVGIDGAAPGSFSSTFTSERLSELVDLQLDASLLSSLHLSVTPYAKNLAQGELDTEFSPSNTGTCTTSGSLFLGEVPSAYQDVLIGFQADEIVLAAHLVGASLSSSGVTTYEQGHRGEFTNTCISAIVVATKATATSLFGQLQAGASFSSLAMADSTDTSSAAAGGALGCIPPIYLDAPLDLAVPSLSIGQVAAPVPFDGSYVLFKVTSRGALVTQAEAVQDVLGAEESAVVALTGRYEAKAHVEVNPTYGSWSGSGANASVAVPSGPADPLLASPGAITPSS